MEKMKNWISYIENVLGEMSGSLDNVCRSLDNVCGSLAQVCGGFGKVVYCEVYKDLTKEMKTIQRERWKIEYPT